MLIQNDCRSSNIDGIIASNIPKSSRWCKMVASLNFAGCVSGKIAMFTTIRDNALSVDARRASAMLLLLLATQCQMFTNLLWIAIDTATIACGLGTIQGGVQAIFVFHILYTDCQRGYISHPQLIGKGVYQLKENTYMNQQT